MWSFVAGRAGAAACSGKRRPILGQAEERAPKEAASEARLGRRGKRQRKRRQTRQRLRSKTRLPERKLRVTSPAWLERRRSTENGNFEGGAPEGRRQKRRESSGKCGGRSTSGSTSAAWPMMRDPREIGKSTEGLAGRRKRTAATEDSSSGTPDGV